MSKRLLTVLVIVGAVAAAGAVAVGLSAINRPAPPPATVQAAPGQNAVAPNSRNIQMQESGAVQIQVMFDAASSANVNAVTFEVSMNTHSVELGGFDLAKLGKVTLEPGGALTDLTWEPAGSGGHHLSGVLTAKDPSKLLTKTSKVTLELTGFPGGQPLLFQWPVIR